MLTVKIERDEFPANPRKEFDNVGTMVCWHRRYTLGDVQPGCTPEEYMRNLAYEVATEEQQAVFDRFDNDDWEDGEEVPNEEELINAIVLKHYVLRALYLYDHSGLSISTSPFSCAWDSGQVGFIYVGKEWAKSEWGTGFYLDADGRISVTPTNTPIADDDAYAELLDGEVKTYNQFLMGDVWEYAIENENGVVLDSCCGIYGEDYCREAAEESKSYLEQRTLKTFEYVFVVRGTGAGIEEALEDAQAALSRGKGDMVEVREVEAASLKVAECY